MYVIYKCQIIYINIYKKQYIYLFKVILRFLSNLQRIYSYIIKLKLSFTGVRTKQYKYKLGCLFISMIDFLWMVYS